MAIPLWDDIQLPPNFTLVDINGIEPEDKRVELQARALELFTEESGEDPTSNGREWSDDEGIFAVIDNEGTIVGVALMIDVENE